jgi:predicted phage terminase large subunit-like protein
MISDAKSVEELINSVNYTQDEFYVPSEFALEFVNFIKLVNGGDGEENKTPVLHYRMMDQVAAGQGRIANMVHRGAAKTTLMGEYFFLYLAFTGGRLPNMSRIEFALYVSDSIENGVKNMRKNLQFRWENSEFLQEYIPETKFTDIEWRFKNIAGEMFIVKGYGAKTGVRGAKSMGKRPKLAVLDDLVSDEDARSATVIQSIEETVYKAVDYALHPTESMIIWSGTPFNANDPLYKAVESGAWSVNVYPVCEKFPCTKEEFHGSWEDRFNYEFVKEKYEFAMKQGKVDTFNQELMLRIMSDEDRLISDSDIKWYNQANLIKNKHFYNFYVTTDFATSEKDSADFSFISVWAVNNNGDWFWVDGMCKKQTMDKNINELFRLVSKYKPQSVGIEVSGQQGGFIPWIQTEMQNRNVWFNLATGGNSNSPGIRPSTNKLQRFNVVVPWFKAGKMYLPDDMRLDPALKELLEELRLVAQSGFKSKHDDAIDTISMLALLHVYLPSENQVSFKKDSVYYTQEDDDVESCYSNYIV